MAELNAQRKPRMDWATPTEFFKKLDGEFRFTLDPCADESNHKCERYFTEDQDGLAQDWSGEVVYCNPPYGRATAKWVKKCHDEVMLGNCRCAVMLIAARTDTQWFHQYIYGIAEVRFVKGRLRFGESKTNAPFASMVVVYRRNEDG